MVNYTVILYISDNRMEWKIKKPPENFLMSNIIFDIKSIS